MSQILLFLVKQMTKEANNSLLTKVLSNKIKNLQEDYCSPQRPPHKIKIPISYWK